jgi:putative PEP-CTERM system histidine kinase
MTSAAILDFSSAVLGVVTALAVLFRQRSFERWLFAAGLTGLAANAALAGLSAVSPLTDSMIGLENAALACMALQPGIWLLFGLTYGRGNYREYLERWRQMVAGAFLLPVCVVLFFHARMVEAVGLFHEELEYPLGTGYRLLGLRLLFVCCLLGAALLMAQIERTFWTAVGTMRWRIKFMALGLGVIFVARFYTSSWGVLFNYIPSTLGTIDAGAFLLGCLLILYSLSRGAFAVSVYPARADLHKSLAVVLAGIYLIVVGLYAKVVELLHTPGSFPRKSFAILLAFVAVGLLVLSDRLRLHARRLVSRYLQRPLYDYRTVWRRITEGTASRVTEQELCQSSVKLAAEIFQALSVSVWLVDEKQENLVFAASTSLSDAMAEKLRPGAEEAAEAIRKLRHSLDPLDIEYSDENWTVALRRAHPSEFGEEGGSRVCVPMIAVGKLLGVMILGDRVGGVLFSLQDYDLLKCVGDQIAASLLNMQLSQRLLQAREMEAFQTMSAFFVHDLKNTASTLNLMLQNLPVHYDNPAFREDALRGIAKSGQHIDNMIKRLSALRHDFKIRPEPADLNDVVAKVLASWKGSANIQLQSNLGSIPKLPFDADQIHKVITNLVLNATEAVARDGRIQVETTQNNGWVIVTVADNGCGMTPEFLNRSLFRAFQTTKKDGFGIGMFQSKMIVEAHGGRLEVESQLHKGTTFKVLLPVAKK